MTDIKSKTRYQNMKLKYVFIPIYTTFELNVIYYLLKIELKEK